MKDGRTTRKHKHTATYCFGVSYYSLVQLPDILQMCYFTSTTPRKSHVLVHSYSFMWVWKVTCSFPRKNINFRNFEKCWRKYILSKRGSKMGLEKLHIWRASLIHILFLVLLVWPTTQIWYGHAAHVEKGEMHTIFWSQKLKRENTIKNWMYISI